jgi:hypothetical protein
MRSFPFTEEVVLRVLEEDGWDEIIKVRANYTGKGMHRACVGFEAPEVRNVSAFLVRLAGETEAEGVDLEDLIDATGTMCSDNMGHDVIVYFPNYDKFAEPTEVEDPYDNAGHEDEARLIALRGMN